MKKRFLSLLLVICLVVGLMPATVFAEGTDTGKAIQLGTSGISDPTSTQDSSGTYYTPSDYVYFGVKGSDPIKWRVLDADKTNDGTTSGMFLLSEYLLDRGVVFESAWNSDDNDGQTNPNEWQHSDAQNWCSTFATNTDVFSTAEQAAFLGVAKTDSAESDLYSIPWGTSSLTENDKVFFLSVRELADYVGDYDGAPGLSATDTAQSAGLWWLRSPYANYTYNAGLVYYNGHVDYNYVDIVWAARPAFNLDLNSVLFISAAEGGKISAAASGGNQGGEAAGSIFEIGDYTGNEWKLTLKDESRRFSANVNGQTNVSAQAGDSVQITYSGAETGDKEYVSVLLCDSSDTVLYYGNIAQNSESGTATVSLPSGLAAGSYKLKVFSEQCNGDYKTDYASAFQEITLTILQKEATPRAVFNAANDNSGTLSNVEPGMKYSVDGGSTWNGITDTTMAITGVTASNDVKVYKPGNGITTSDSAVQTIDVTQAEPPTGVLAVDCTTSEQNDGQITGVDSTMEYKLSTASEWTSISGNTVSGLANGTYEVRVKADGTVLASAAATVTIGAHTCAAQGDWQHDENEHWKLCACGAEVDRAAHMGGTATCTEKAVCDVCGSSYGAINPDNHTGEIVWTKTATAHSSKYSCCDAVVVAEEAHEWENGVCAECGYECQHDGGTATCTEKAVCDICGEEYGEVNAASHTNLVKTEDKAATHMTEGNIEYWYCDGCDKYFSDEAGTQEIALADTVIPKLTEHTADGSGWHSDEAGHWNTCECGEMLNEAAHTFEWVTDKEATAAEAGSKHEECTVCGYAKAAVEIPATGDKSPQTGDNSNMPLWIALLFVSGGVLSVVTYRKKKQTN